MEYLYKHPNGVSFRRVQATDLDALLDLKSESWYGTHRVSLLSRDSQWRWLEALDAESIHAPSNLVLVAASAVGAGEAPQQVEDVGIWKVLDIDWQSRRASVGWDLYKTYRGHGLGKNLVQAGVSCCFAVLNLHRLQADILATNHISRKCAEAAGFAQEGLQRRAILRGGRWLDNLIYGLLAPDPD